MMVRNKFCLCKCRGVVTREMLSIRRWIRKDVFDPKRLAQRLSVAVAWRCICRTSLLPRRIQTAANTAPIAKGQKLALLR